MSKHVPKNACEEYVAELATKIAYGVIGFAVVIVLVAASIGYLVGSN
jgi:hypothetical protein